MEARKDRTIIFIFLLFVLIILTLAFIIPKPTEVSIKSSKRSVDFSAADFSDDTVYNFQGDWNAYPDRLYGPDDFVDDSIDEKPIGYQSEKSDIIDKVDYATFTVSMKLPANETYGIYFRSPNTAMKVFVDGKKMGQVGKVGESEDDSVPQTGRRSYFFTPTEETTTMIIQTSNYVYKEGAYPPEFVIGYAASISEYASQIMIVTFLVVGSMLTAFLYHLGLYLVNRRRKPLLVFSVVCLLLTFLTNNMVPIYLREYDWAANVKMQEIVMFMTFMFTIMFLRTLFPKMLADIPIKIYYSICLIVTVVVIVAPAKYLTLFYPCFYGVSVIIIIYMLIKLLISLRGGTIKNILAFIGILSMSLLAFSEMSGTKFLLASGKFTGLFFSTPVAMLFFVFCFTMVVAIDFAEADRASIIAEGKIVDAEKRYYDLLEKNKSMTPDKTLDDFNLSNREKDVALLLIDGKTRIEIASDLNISMGSVNTYCSRIYKKADCNGLLDMLILLGIPRNITEGDTKK